MVRTAHGRNRILVWSALVLTVAIAFLYAPYASAQSLTTGAISGVVTDPTGALVPGATVTVTQLGTGSTRTVTTQADGAYTISLLSPGQYSVKVAASGFRTAEQGPVTVELSATSSLNVRLEVGQASQTVEVSGAAPLIETANPNTTTNVSAAAIANLPNPGNDLSYVAQVAPGAVMNTTGGYGNMEFNGLPATSTNFTIDGMDANDPFLNLNNSGATNLQLGLNAVQEASVNTLSYGVDQGRQGAAQVNFLGKSGSNQTHGNLFYLWNGAAMNSVDWFVNAQPTGTTAHRGRSNVNEFGGSIGGHILHDKLFYFADVEGLRIALPTVLTEYYPTQAWESYVLGTIPKGGYDPQAGVSFAPPANPQVAVAAYQKAFNLYGNPGVGTPIPNAGCPLGVDGNTGLPAGPNAVGSPTPDGNGCVNRRVYPFANDTHDLYLKGRIDHEISAKDKVWYSYDYEKGVQATYTDPVNRVFNSYSTQPADGLAIGFTHIFGPNLVNDFNPGYQWYSALFQPTPYAPAVAASPYEFAGSGLSSIFGAATAWPQGRDVTNWQIIDNLTWTKGSHEFKFGENLRRTLVSDHDTTLGAYPYITSGDLAQYSYDVGYGYQGFPTSGSEPVGLVAFDAYAQDTWKAKSNVTITYGIRATWNANPVEQHGNFARFTTGDFYSFQHDVNVPFNQIITPHSSYLAYSTPLIVWQPRASVAWSIRPKTVFRAGAGMFSDIFPASIADKLLTNFPNDNSFGAGWNSAPTASYLIPGSGSGTGATGDVLAADAVAQQALLAGFSAGVPSCAATNAPSNCLSPASYTSIPSGEFKYPMFYEWSGGIEQQFGESWGLKVQYVGTHASQLPYTYDPNGVEDACAGCFSPYPYTPQNSTSGLPTQFGVDPRFTSITQFATGANSTYNALQTSLQKRTSKGLTLNLNYSWSHCIDELSNEGALTGNFNPNQPVSYVSPGELYLLRGNCDYDVRNALNGNYIYQLPALIHNNKILGAVLNGWQVSGDLFVHSGYPFSVFSSGFGAGGAGCFYCSDPNFATPTGATPYAKWQTGLSTQTPGVAEIQWLNPAAFENVVDGVNGGNCSAGETLSGGAATAVNNNASTCQFARGGRNNVFGPGFGNTDLFLSKVFKISERAEFKFDIQAYNVFNHANFAQPGTTAGVQGVPSSLTNAFTIASTVNEPTGLLGSGLGGDNSVRMIALRGMLTF